MTRRIPPDLSATPFDAIIIGAGINGAGIARDAAMRGLRVLLLDKGDVASGTTAASTRLIHGGLRYLEHGEVGLVRESLRERETLLRVAPHLVRPISMLVPVYARRTRGALKIRAGMLAYDLLSLGKSLPRHRMLDAAGARAVAPALGSEGLKGAALFHDAQVEYAERLAVENVLSAREHGATVLTYARVERLLTDEGGARGVEFKDLLGGGRYEACAPLVLNVAGPWADEVLDSSDGGGQLKSEGRLIGGTKGSHVVVHPFEGAPGVAVYAEAVEDGRPFFVIPWDGKFLVGTTDEAYAGDPDGVAASGREVEYLLRETNRLMPSARLTRDDILYAYSGVRPLAFLGEKDESAITRRHFVRPSRVRGLFSVVGGKLTTYRSLAEEVVDMLFRNAGRTPPPCATARAPLPGAAGKDPDGLRESFAAEGPLPPKSASRLLKVYGVRAAEVLRAASEDGELLKPISEETGSIAAEVLFAFRSELAETLVDCLMRRTMAGLNSRLGLDALYAAAHVAREFLGWDGARADAEIEDYRRYIKRFCPKLK